jgi:hypothetical protein
MHARVVKQLCNGARNTAAIEWIGIEVTYDNERRVAR